MGNFEELGDHMKDNYERRSQTKLPRRTNAILRIDGRAFHTFTRRFKRPYDEDLMRIMDTTALRLCSEVAGVKLAFVQSDEISLWVTDYDTITTQPWFDYEVQKMCSCASSYAAAEFIRQWLIYVSTTAPEMNPWSSVHEALTGLLPTFDCRAFTIPDPVEVHNYFVWRQRDAERNALLTLGQCTYSHKQIQGLSTLAIDQKMAADHGENWKAGVHGGFLRGRMIVKQISGWSVDYNYPRFVDDHQIVLGRVPRFEETNEKQPSNLDMPPPLPVCVSRPTGDHS